jgi:arginine/lysine/ornithine decarboxylase
LAQGKFVLLQSALYFTRQDAEKILKVIKNLGINHNRTFIIEPLPPIPQVVLSPREAFYADKTQVPLLETVGKISGEFVIPYPPGIPVLVPGEVITQDIKEYLCYLRKHKIKIHGPRDLEFNTLAVVDY